MILTRFPHPPMVRITARSSYVDLAHLMHPRLYRCLHFKIMWLYALHYDNYTHLYMGLR